MQKLLKYIFLVFLLTYDFKVLGQKLDIQVNGVSGDTVASVNVLQSLKVNVTPMEHESFFKNFTAMITHLRTSTTESKPYKRSISSIHNTGLEFGNDYYLEFPKIRKGDILHFRIEFGASLESKPLIYEHEKIIGSTKVSESKPYFLEIHVYDDDLELVNHSEHISIIKNRKAFSVSNVHTKFTKGEVFSSKIEGNRYYFHQMPDSLELRFKYEKLGIFEYFYLDTDFLKYGGVICIGIIRSQKYLNRKYKAQIDSLPSFSYQGGPNPFLSKIQDHDIYESLIYMDYERFPLNNGTKYGTNRPIYLTKRQKKHK